MATYTITTDADQEAGIARQLKIDNGERLKRNLTEMNNTQWVQEFFNQQLNPITQQAKGEVLNRVIDKLRNDPVKLAEIADSLA